MDAGVPDPLDCLEHHMRQVTLGRLIALLVELGGGRKRRVHVGHHDSAAHAGLRA